MELNEAFLYINLWFTMCESWVTTLISFILIHFGEKIRKHIKDLIVNKIIENEKFRNFLRIIKK